MSGGPELEPSAEWRMRQSGWTAGVSGSAVVTSQWSRGPDVAAQEEVGWRKGGVARLSSPRSRPAPSRLASPRWLLHRPLGHAYTDSQLFRSVFSQHIRLKRRPPPPPPSLLVRPPAPASTHNRVHAARRSIPLLSSTRPRSLLPPTTTTSSLSSSGRYHLSHASSSSSHLPQPPADVLPLPDSSPDSLVAPLPEPQAQAQPDSPPWQPAEELHIAPEALARFRAFREDYVRRNFRRGEGDDPEREIASLAGFGLGDEDDDEDDEDYGEEMDLSALLDESDGQDDDEGTDALAPVDPVVADAVVVDDVDSYVPFSFPPHSSLPSFVPAFLLGCKTDLT